MATSRSQAKLFGCALSMFRSVLTLLAVGGISLHVSAQQASATSGGDLGVRRAIITGISEYANYDMLPGAAADAQNIGSALPTIGFNTPAVLVSSNGATLKKSNFVEKLREVANKCSENDLLLIYFAGHGSRRNGMDYLLFSDTDPQKFEKTAFAIGTGGQMDLPDCLASILKFCKARNRVIILDACRSTSVRDDGATPLGKDFDSKFQARMDRVVRAAPRNAKGVQGAVFYACSPGETSKEDPAKNAGVFTGPLVDGIKGSAKDLEGRITLGGLLAYVNKNIPSRPGGGAIQTPQIYPSTDEQLKMVLGTLQSSLLTARKEPFARPDGVVNMVWVEGAKAFQSGMTARQRDDLLALYPEGARDKIAADLSASVDRARGDVPGFWIDEKLVTVKQFAMFREAKKKEGVSVDWPILPTFTESFQIYKNWMSSEYPMVNVPPRVAKMYAEWVGGDLPTEVEWELAARGPQGRAYPWGDKFDAHKAHSSVGKEADGPAVSGQYESGASPFGALDMSGNLWQWCRTGAQWCLHGGSWKESDELHLRSDYSRGEFDDMKNDGVIGFRVVIRKNPPKGHTIDPK